MLYPVSSESDSEDEAFSSADKKKPQDATGDAGGCEKQLEVGKRKNATKEKRRGSRERKKSDAGGSEKQWKVEAWKVGKWESGKETTK